MEYSFFDTDIKDSTKVHFLVKSGIDIYGAVLENTDFKIPLIGMARYSKISGTEWGVDAIIGLTYGEPNVAIEDEMVFQRSNEFEIPVGMGLVFEGEVDLIRLECVYVLNAPIKSSVMVGLTMGWKL